MPRASPAKQAEKMIAVFFDETQAGLMKDVMSTRQPTRRAELLAQLDTFDKVKGRFYHWLTSRNETA